MQAVNQLNRLKWLSLFLIVLVTACTNKKGQVSNTDHNHARVATDTTHAKTIMVSDRQMALANITTQSVGAGQSATMLKVNATLQANADNTTVISSRAGGRIEKLYVKEPGRTIKKGEPLYDLYSESLLAYQREYLMALEQYALLGDEQPHYKSIVTSAQRKLIQYGLTSQQVEKLASAKKVSRNVTFLAPSAGVITDIAIKEGAYATEGQALYTVSDLATLWVETELYPGETESLTIGNTVTATVAGQGTVDARITFMSPEYRNNSQIVLLRAVINNMSGKYKPGMQAQVSIQKGSGTTAITVPLDAVIRGSHGNHVYVQSEANTFQPRKVITGIENENNVVVLSGLQPGEHIAATGAYLLYSEWVLKRGIDPMIMLNQSVK